MYKRGKAKTRKLAPNTSGRVCVAGLRLNNKGPLTMFLILGKTTETIYVQLKEGRRKKKLKQNFAGIISRNEQLSYFVNRSAAYRASLVFPFGNPLGTNGTSSTVTTRDEEAISLSVIANDTNLSII